MGRPIGTEFSSFTQVSLALQRIGDGEQSTYKVASLDDLRVPVGTMVFATDALDVGETTGNGTGCLVVKKSDGWKTVYDNTAPTT